MKSFSLKPCAAAVAVAAFQMANPAYAVNCTLTTNGLWQTTTDWSCGARPGSGDSATISIGGLVTINQAEQITTLANAGTINISASTLTLLGGGTTVNSGTINVGGVSTAALQVQNNIVNTGGTINVANGSVINQFGTTITGGTINTTGTGALVANNNGNNFLNGVTLNGVMDLATNVGIERIGAGTGLTLNGTVNINQNSILSFDGGAQTLGGAATITFGNSGGSNRLTLENGGTLTTSTNTLIHGQSGTIGGAAFVGGNATLNNAGTISADVSGGQISLIPSTTNNSNTLSAKNGGQLVLGGAVNNLGSGHIDAIGAASNVYQNGVAITGGTLNTSGGGTFVASNNGGNSLSAATLNGTIDLATNVGQERVLNGMTMVTGSNVNLNNNSIFTFDGGGSQTLGGTGTITLGDTGGSNRIGIENSGTLTVGSGILIHGKNGTIGGQAITGGGSTLINNGTISADVAGGTINLATNNGAANAIQNNGILSAANGGTLVLSSSVAGGAGGAINVAANSALVQNGVTVSGTINTTGNGSFVSTNTSANFLNGVTLNGNLDLASNVGVEQVTNGLTLNGGIAINQNSQLIFAGGTQTLGGNGTITLGNTGGSNRLGIDSAGTLNVASGITIHGQNGTIGGTVNIGGTNTLNNSGTITADVAGGQLAISASTTNNSNVVSATNGGQILLNNAFNNLGSGHLDAIGTGSTVVQNGITITGGTINTNTGGSLIATNNGANFLGGVTLNGNLDLATNVGVEQITNGLTLNGGIAINQNSQLIFAGGTQTLAGNGTITLGNTGGSNRLGIDSGGTLNVASGITIHGQSGTIGAAVNIGGASTLNNSGTISADVAGGVFDMSASTTNNSSVVSALNGGQIRLNNAFNNIGSGHLDAIGTGSTIAQNGITITGGTINTNTGGSLIATNNGANFLSGVTLNGNLDLATNVGVEQITNGLTLNGGIAINQNSQLIFAGGTQTLNGNGTITLGNTGGSNRLGIDSAGTLNVASGVTINGQNGTVGAPVNIGGASTLNNSGTIRADVAGGLITVAANTLTNNGTLAATAGTLTINPAFTGTGTVLTTGTGQVNVGGPSTVGTLINNGTTATALNLGGNNITVSTDYNNASFGTGNAFNKTANITGTGLVLSSGSTTAQAVTGANVTNGATTSPTLTIGNVRVGGTTYNYQVANSDASGPALRGAIQTSVNGGNITDSRLSGAGVTASNYGPVVGGSNSGNLGVTFTASSAGALAPLTGQSVHLANNFANVGEQTLNIALASGAAAYNVAIGSTTPSPIAFGNVRVGTADSQALTVHNTQTAGSYSEDLNAAFGTSTGNAAASGSLTGLVAGGANASALSASLNTTTAGAKSGTVTINYATGGTVNGVSNGLGTLGIGSQTIALSGSVYNAAVGATSPSPVTIANQRIGGSNSSALTVANTAAAGGFSEALNASIGSTTGTATGSGSVVNIAAGSSNNTALSVGVNTTTAGAKSGSVSIAYQTDGTGSNGHSGLSAIGAGSQNVNVSGNVYQTAAGTITTAPLNFGTVQVGQVVSQVLSVQNSATGASGFVEDLNARFGATSGTNGSFITGSGSIAGLAAGASSNGLTVGVNTSTVGTVSGSIAVNFFSAGAVGGVSNGLGELAVGSAGYGVNGTITTSASVVNQASPLVNNPTIALGNVRIGSASPTGLVSVTNQATTSPQAALNASISGAGGITASGSFNLLNPGATNATSLAVGLNTSVAGNQSGNATIAFVSDASNIGGCGSACQMAIGSQNVAVTGAVYRLANPTATPTTVTVAGRVGSTAPTTALTIANASPDLYTEGLTVTRGATSSGFTATGGITNLAAGASSSAIGVTLNTAVAGTYSGTQALNYVSTGAGTTGAADVAVGSGTVTLAGKVYTTAVANNNTPSVAFGIVHVGDTASHAVSVTNSAAVTALNDTLVVNAAGASGPFTATGSVSGLTAGSTSTALTVGLNTATAGVYSGSAAFSAASHDADLSDAALASLAVSLSGQVNNYAADAFTFASGAGSFTQVGSTYVLDYGTVAQNSGTRTTTLNAANSASGPADSLAGTFQFLDPADFGESGFAAFLALAAGQSTGPLTLSFDSMTAGSFLDTIVLHGIGSNASGYAAALGDIQLIVRGIVSATGTPPISAVPEPDSLILLGLGIPLLFLRRGRKSAAKAPHA